VLRTTRLEGLRSLINPEPWKEENMPVCPFAVQRPISGPSGSYTGGPFKIVHHTTEGSSAQGAFAAFSRRSEGGRCGRQLP
jgi:hypothetical protein